MAKSTTTKPSPSSRKRTTTKAGSKKQSSKKIIGSCFVMMPFTESFENYYQQLYKPDIEKVNLEPMRTLDLFRPNVIVSDIWEMIQNSKALLAELTTRNANVFYELGLGHAIGKPIILISETMDDVPFDLQQLRIILYDKNDPMWGNKLSSEISSALEETLEKPIDSVPSIFRKAVASQAPEQDEIHIRLDALEQRHRSLSRELNQTRNRNLRRGSYSMELDEIHGPDELDEWAIRWHKRGVRISALKRAIVDHRTIPSDEAPRISDMLTSS